MGTTNNSNLKILNEFNIKIKQIIKNKHKTYFSLQKKILYILKDYNKIYKLNSHLHGLFYSIKHSKSQDCLIPFIQLENYMLANLEDRHHDKQLLKSKRKQFFYFAKQNLTKIDSFILTKVLHAFNLSAKQKNQTSENQNLAEIKKMLEVVIKIASEIIQWFYGDEIIQGLCNDDPQYQDANQGIREIYIAQLTEFIVFYDKNSENELSKLRKKQIEIMASRIKQNVLSTVKSLKYAPNPKKQHLFPKDDENCYNIITHFIQKIAKASLLSTKFKFICIIFDTIPTLYIQHQFQKTKSDTYKTFCTSSLDRNSRQPSSAINSFNRNFEIQNTISDLLSTQSKRQLAKYLLIQWYKTTNCDILKDVLIPLKILMQEQHLKDKNALLAFLHALYEIVGVDDMENSELV